MELQLLNGDCLELMKELNDNSIDLLFTDLPYGEIAAKWDINIDLEQFWKQVNRICKINAPMFFCCSARFGSSLIQSNPKYFRYDMVWKKSCPCGFLNGRKMPLRIHELVYVFYRKIPFYDISSHIHKYVDVTVDEEKEPFVVKEEDIMKTDVYRDGLLTNKSYYKSQKKVKPLPEGVVYDVPSAKFSELNSCYGARRYRYKNRAGDANNYEPRLPVSVLEIKSEKGKHPTQKPVELMRWCLKYYSKEGDVVLDPTAGSGSTGVACKEMNRKFIGIEKDEKIYNDAKIRLGL